MVMFFGYLGLQTNMTVLLNIGWQELHEQKFVSPSHWESKHWEYWWNFSSFRLSRLHFCRWCFRNIWICILYIFLSIDEGKVWYDFYFKLLFWTQQNFEGACDKISILSFQTWAGMSLKHISLLALVVILLYGIKPFAHIKHWALCQIHHWNYFKSLDHWLRSLDFYFRFSIRFIVALFWG